jgi:undecaprenyl-diphosphatase
LQLDFLQVNLLAIVQGLTEFLPISSSAHLILPSLLFNWPDQGLTFDVAVHLGTLLAVLVYFYQDIVRLLRALLASVFTSERSLDSKLAWLLVIATVPAGVTGWLLDGVIETYARSELVIAVASLLFACLLWWADRSSDRNRGLEDLNWKSALFIGVAQALALIPGTSRSGITMTAALLCQLSRQAAARFSFLMAIPIILASGLLKSAQLFQHEGETLSLGLLLYATLVAAVVAYSCIHYFLRLIERVGYLPFVLYRIILGLLLLVLYLA